MQKISIVLDVQGKIIKTCVHEKFFILKVTLSLTLGLGLGLTLRKTISVENLKPNAKD